MIAVPTGAGRHRVSMLTSCKAGQSPGCPDARGGVTEASHPFLQEVPASAHCEYREAAGPPPWGPLPPGARAAGASTKAHFRNKITTLIFTKVKDSKN